MPGVPPPCHAISPLGLPDNESLLPRLWFKKKKSQKTLLRQRQRFGYKVAAIFKPRALEKSLWPIPHKWCLADFSNAPILRNEKKLSYQWQSHSPYRKTPLSLPRIRWDTNKDPLVDMPAHFNKRNRATEKLSLGDSRCRMSWPISGSHQGIS